MTPTADHQPPRPHQPRAVPPTGYQVAKDAGFAALELAIATPVLIGLLLLVIAAGRISAVTSTIDDAAISASRSASIARTASQARADATAAARAVLHQQGVTCTGGPTIDVDLAGFRTRPGRPADVTVHVRCTASMAPLPGTRTRTATSVSVLDTYRERTS